MSNVAVVETTPNPDITPPSAVGDLVANLPASAGLPRALTASGASTEQVPDFGMQAVADGDPTTAWSTLPSAIDQEEWVRVDLGEVEDRRRHWRTMRVTHDLDLRTSSIAGVPRVPTNDSRLPGGEHHWGPGGERSEDVDEDAN